MNALVLPLLLAAALGTTAVAGPWMLRAAAPVLMRVPRLSVLLLCGSVLLWLLAAAASSLSLAAAVTGPSVLPTPAAEVCRRCLDAAGPFTPSTTLETGIPVVLLLVLPGLALALLLGTSTYRWAHRRRATLSVARAVAHRARATRIAGHAVLVIHDSGLVVFSLPQRSGGIVVSDGLLAALEPTELAAVLEHEHAHLRQRHHLILTVLAGLVRPLRWVPLVSAVADALPHYLEIAADDAARRRTGTPALAAALLKLGTPHAGIALSAGPALDSPVLHAAGPDRIGHLVAPAATGVAVLPTALLALQLTAFTVAAAAVHVPYLYAALAGCPLPT